MPRYPYRDLGTKLNRDFRNNLNANFDDIEADIRELYDGVDDLDTRIDNIVADVGNSNAEIVDARYDAVNNVTYPTLKDRLDDTSDKIGILKKNAVNILEFGADPTGSTNSTKAIKDALAYARDNGVKKVFAPDGIYLFDAVKGDTNPNAVVVYQGLTLEGNGYNTVFKINPSSISGNGSYRGILYQSQATLKNFRVDGSKNDINRTNITSANCYTIRGYNKNQSGAFLQDIWIHDVIGVNQESFGFMNHDGEHDFKLVRVQGWNIEGTPIHIAGDYLNDVKAHNVDVIDCVGYNSTWQGISIYGADNVRLINPVTYGNSGNGINLEWALNIEIVNPKTHDNGIGGIGTYGQVDFKVHGGESYNNNQSGNHVFGDIALRAGSWYTGSPVPRAVCQRAEIHNLKITPLSGQPHIYIESDVNVTVGDVYPTLVLLNSPDAKDWLIKVREPNGTTRTNGFLPNLKYANLVTVRKLATGKLSDYAVSGATITPYTDGGNRNPNAVRVTANAQFNNIYTKYILKPYSKYLIHIRYKNETTNPWVLIMRESTMTKPYHQIYLYGTSKTIGNWYEAQAIFVTDDVPYRVQLQYNGTAANDTIVIDYINVIELSSNTVQSETHFDSAWNGELLTLGTYRLWVDSSGKLRIKNGVPTSDTDGTVVGTQS